MAEPDPVIDLVLEAGGALPRHAKHLVAKVIVEIARIRDQVDHAALDQRVDGQEQEGGLEEFLPERSGIIRMG